MTNGEREFPLGQVLTVLTGKMLMDSAGPTMADSLRPIKELLEYMADEPLDPWQFGRVADEVRPVILTCYPKLAAIVVPTLPAGKYKDWLASQVPIYGDRFSLPKLTPGQHVRITSEQELLNRVSPDQVYIIDDAADKLTIKPLREAKRKSN